MSTIKEKINEIKNVILFYFYRNNVKKEKDCFIDFGKNTRYSYCNIIVHGKNNRAIFGDGCSMRGLRILVEGNNNSIDFGNDVTVNASKIQPTIINAVGGTSITIGEGSLLSNNIEVHSTDYHGIFDKEGNRTNYDKDIIIGKHVWIGLGCKILKGSRISNGSIVGAGSLVTNSFEQENCILAGNPAKIIKTQVFWKPERADYSDLPNELKEKWKV